MDRRIRIVVGEGRTAQRGLLRFVLEGEGFEVVGEARGAADLTGTIEQNEPDVVVLDDGIGVMAVSMVHEVAPRAKVVLVWPSAVVPIGGDARVEPAKILRDLGPAVEDVMAPAAALTETFERPAWIDRVRKDPATLREKLGNGKEKPKRPSVTRLQRRSKRLHPTGNRSGTTDPMSHEEDVPAPVVVLPVGTAGSDLEPIVDIGGASAGSEPADEPVEERSEWNRRLGMLALSGAAAVSALVLALALGGGRVSPSLVRGGGDVPVGVPGFDQGGVVVGQGPFGSGSLGGSGWDPSVVVGSDEGEGTGSEGEATDGDGGPAGELAAPDDTGAEEPAPVEEPVADDVIDDGDGVDDGGGNGGNGGNGGGNGGNGGGGGGTGGGGGGGNGGGGGGGGGGTGKPSSDTPGKSGEHNPHGGPPGQMGMTPAHGPGLGASVAGQQGPQKHAHKN